MKKVKTLEENIQFNVRPELKDLKTIQLNLLDEIQSKDLDYRSIVRSEVSQSLKSVESQYSGLQKQVSHISESQVSVARYWLTFRRTN